MREGTYSKLQLVLNCKYQTHFKCVPSIEQRATVSGWIYFFCSMCSHSLPFLNCFNLFVKYEWEFWESCVVHSSSIYYENEWLARSKLDWRPHSALSPCFVMNWSLNGLLLLLQSTLLGYFTRHADEYIYRASTNPTGGRPYIKYDWI